MPLRNETSTSFKDEIRIIPWWAYFFAILAFVVIVPAAAIAPQLGDKNPPPVWAMLLFGVIAGAALGCYLLLIGYVNRDARRRGMSPVLWTVIAIFIPNALGIVLYFVLRKPRISVCPQCGATVEPGFGFCPHCRHPLAMVCPKCQRALSAGDKFCPYCSEPIPAITTQVSS